MARLPRLALAGLPHYVVQSAVHGQAMALDDTDQRALLAALYEAAASQQVAVWGYALLPQALHLLLCPATADGVGRTLQRLGRRYVPAFNRRHQRSGALWAGRFRAAVVEPGPWVLAALLRIEGLGQAAPSGGECSSAAHHLGQLRDPHLAELPELWALGNTPFERESAWRDRLDAGLDATTEALLARAVHGTWAAGTPAFLTEVAVAAGRPSAPRPAGRRAGRVRPTINMSPIK